jgi:polyisoprenoid-binding protein YceI
MKTTLDQVRLPRPGTYQLDPTASSVTFATKHLFGLGKVEGSFELTSATLEVADTPERSNAHAVVDASSFASGSSMRDKQVHSKKFLAATEHPQIAFTSTGVHRVQDSWVVDGLLTVRGRSEPVHLTVLECLPDQDTLTLVATTRVDRYAFGIRASRGMAGRHLDITLRLTARPQHH